MIVVDLSKEQALDADPKAIRQISFTANLDRAGNTRIYLILEETKETVLEFSQGTVKVLLMQFHWNVLLDALIFINIKWGNTTV